MRKFKLTAVALTISAAAAGGVAIAPSASAATPCPSGAFCIRETNGSILSRNIFYSYGPHNLTDVTGNRVLINNQTGGAGFKLCYGYNGSGACSAVDRARETFAPYPMGPINSIVLVK